MSTEWLGLSHATLSGGAVVGGSGTGGPLPARGEPRPRVTGAEPGGAGPGGAALGTKAQGGEDDAPQVRRGSGWMTASWLCHSPHTARTTILPLLCSTVYGGLRLSPGAARCSRWELVAEGRTGAVSGLPACAHKQSAAPLARCPPTQPGRLRVTGEGGSARRRL